MKHIDLHQKPEGNIPDKDGDNAVGNPMTMFLLNMEIDLHPIGVKEDKGFKENR